MKYRSMFCACCDPRPVAPTGARMTSGTWQRPPDMYRIFVALLMIWSLARKRKSPYCTSAIGLIPIISAPTATPKKPSSAIGVLIIRSGNLFSRPRVTVNAPPQPPGTAMSSPIQKTALSRSISSAMPSRRASAIACRFISALLRHKRRSVDYPAPVEERFLLARPQTRSRSQFFLECHRGQSDQPDRWPTAFARHGQSGRESTRPRAPPLIGNDRGHGASVRYGDRSIARAIRVPGQSDIPQRLAWPHHRRLADHYRQRFRLGTHNWLLDPKRSYFS